MPTCFMFLRGAFTKSQLQKTIARAKRSRVCIITVAGRRKAGKSIFVEYLKTQYPGFRHVRIADAPLAVTKVLGLPPDRQIYQALFGINTLLFPILKESVFKRRAAEILDREKPKHAIVEALRTEEEYQEFVAKRGGILVGINAHPKIRYQRTLSDARQSKEKQDEAALSFKEFIGDPHKKTGEYRPIERGVGRIIKRSHFILENNSTKTDFYGEIDEVMRFLGVKKRRN